MSDCCSTNVAPKATLRRHQCPVNGKTYKAVPAKTIVHHMQSPWDWQAKEQGYYYCEDPDCDVVYFGEDNSVIEQSALRTLVGIKDQLPDALLCYCFGVSRAMYETDAELKTYVMEKTKQQVCACDIRNPSGRCCLKDFPKHNS